jgi:hypothetical protein
MRMNLAATTPQGQFASTGYAPADAGSEYLVYMPAKRGKRLWRKLPNWFPETVAVDLSNAAGDLKFEWFQPDAETTVAAGRVAGGSTRSFAALVLGGDLVLYIHRK